MTKIILMSLLILGAIQAQAQNMKQTYRVTFKSLWNVTDHIRTPSNAHFSPIVAVAHNSQYELFLLGGLTSPELEPVAELGQTTLINQQIDEAGSNIGQTLNTENLFINQATEQTFDIMISPEHPYLSFVSMIAPSPDWIVGLSQLKLYSEKEGFLPGLTQPLYALDAGTESGDFAGNFSINNPESTPRTPIQQLRGQGFNAPFAEVTITPIN